MNEGKLFESDFKNSIPDDVYYLRLKDTGGWSNATNTRFSPQNECDCIIFYDSNMYMLEFKSHKGKSLPFSCISDKQKESLVKAYEKGVKAGYVINFRDLEETYFISALELDFYIKGSEKKSISVGSIRLRGHKIEQEKKRTRWKYNVEKMLKDVI